jgi:hypothetical protein
MMDRRLGASGARKTARRSPRELYVTSIQFNNNQNNCSISHKTPNCQPNVMISSAVFALLFACRRPNAPPLPKAATRPVSTGQSADRQEPGVEEKWPVMCSDEVVALVRTSKHTVFMVQLLLGYSLNLQTWASGVLQHTHIPGGCAWPHLVMLWYSH